MHPRTLTLAVLLVGAALFGVSKYATSPRSAEQLTVAFNAAPPRGLNGRVLRDGRGRRGRRRRAQTSEQMTPARPNPSVLFVKFHKVGGTTAMVLINRLAGVADKDEACARDCKVGCVPGRGVCTGHKSLHAMGAARAWTSLPEQGLAGRSAALHTAKHSSEWLPPDAPLVAVTLLRDPAERIRSRYVLLRLRLLLLLCSRSSHLRSLRSLGTTTSGTTRRKITRPPSWLPSCRSTPGCSWSSRR